jgi:hypothetical protein
MIGGRKTRSNKGKNRGAYGPRSGKTRSGARFRGVNRSANRNRVNSNNRVNVNNNAPVRKTRKARSNKGKKRTPYGPRGGKTRSGRRFR